MLDKLSRDAILRQGSPVENLMAFVMSEQGRAADLSLEDSRPLVLYFGNESDREVFLAVAREAMPGAVTKVMPPF